MKKYDFEWVTTTDVDEYILVTQQQNDDINNKNNKNKNKNTQSMSSSNFTVTNHTSDDDDNNDREPELQRLVNSIVSSSSNNDENDKIGGLCLNSIPFGRNTPIEPKETMTFPLLIDYIWRDKEDPSLRAWKHYKFIYNARLVIDLGVHYLYRTSNGNKAKEIRLDVMDQARINHYKNPDAGVYMVNRKYDRYMNDTIMFDR
eukprot:CAMPEP_0203666324 /NCGR_PEP_ID=MMETSP0090-20130426/3378_1 /ASSEMBLY_ACC=CAM_ASM_001088 /TAXON_ID=426623 /ORGANISM="Chaetoceros affinis, Strain CCMP159" /LENGTH=201 /DNA_ID=CAMNT_0050530167 /DNA_START=168 /DNA_END=769 /DNA_ORIENTATION=+